MNSGLTDKTDSSALFSLSTALLSLVFGCCLFYGRLAWPLLLALSLSFSVALAFFSRQHDHNQYLAPDIQAQGSRLRDTNAMLKFITAVACMLIVVASPNALTGVFVMLAMALVVVWIGGVKLHEYLNFLALPASFVLVGGLALLFEAVPDPVGVINLRLPWCYLVVSEASQAATALVVARACGALSCLGALSLTTPMPDIIAVLRRLHCPDLVVDLMYLIYRYIFILLSLNHAMLTAARSRLGLRDLKTSLRATGMIYANLLSYSYRIANNNFDAMESRCYSSGIRFYSPRHRVTGLQAVFCLSLLALVAGLGLVPL